MNAPQQAKQVAHSDTMKRLARVGLAARATVYLLVGIVALLLAVGHGGAEPDQRGALQDLAGHTFGFIILWAVLLGLLCFALWCFSQAAFGAVGEGDKAGPRIQQFVSGCAYGALAASTFTIVIHHHSKSQAGQQESWTAKAMSHSFGRWAVALVGLVIVIVGLAMIYEGVSKRFEKKLNTAQMSESTRHTVQTLGITGSVARGVVFGISGALLVDAAWTYDAKKARGLDGALRSLQHATAGPWLLALAALGLIAFGAYGYAEAKWRRT